MRFSFRQSSLVVAVVLFAWSSILTFGQAKKSVNPRLGRMNPDRWFSFLIPKSMGNPRRFADVDGGFYDAPDLRITFSYWTHKGTPNFIRNSGISSPQELVLVCSKSRQTRIFRTRIASRKAIVQRCPESGASNFRYLYYVNFPKLDVFDGDFFGAGTFTLTVNYNNKHYLNLASRIANSMRFKRAKRKR